LVYRLDDISPQMARIKQELLVLYNSMGTPFLQRREDEVETCHSAMGEWRGNRERGEWGQLVAGGGLVSSRW
jgi:hypothetical protein